MATIIETERASATETVFVATKPSGKVASTLLVATCFICGLVVMALELLGFRMLAPYFGYSIYVSGSLIGAILTALSIGYFVGGRIIDRRPRRSMVYWLVLAADAYLFVMLWLHTVLLEAIWRLNAIGGSLLATTVIFVPPMVLLGTVSPAVIRLLTREGKIGTSAGNIFAVSTAGSIAGSFLAPFLLIPAFGTRMTLAGCAIVLLAVSVGGLMRKRPAATASVALMVFCFLPPSPPSPETINVVESPYSRLTVLQTASGQRLLEINRGWLSSVAEWPDHMAYTVFDSFLVGPVITDPDRVLVLGMGAGTSVKQIAHFFPRCTIDAVDIDAEVVRLADEYFGVREGPRLRVFLSDARPYLARCEKTYDFIEVDLFLQGPYIPFYVATRQFFDLVNSRLTERGCVVFNVLAPDDDRELANPIGATMREVFPSVFEMRAERKGKRLPNMCLIGMKSKTELSTLKEKAFNCTIPGLVELSTQFYRSLKEFSAPEGTAIFTDDSADVERINFAVVSRYVEARRRSDAETK